MYLHSLSSTNAGRIIILGVVGFVMAAVCVTLFMQGNVRLALALTVGLFLLAVCMQDPKLFILGALIYLVGMAEFRRLLIPIAGWKSFDPLLLAVPAGVVVIMMALLAQRRIQLETWAARVTAGLCIVMFLQIFNPKQGGFLVGMGGALFYLVPISWFWIARMYLTPAALDTLFRRVLPILGFGAVVMGLLQSFFGYLPHQQQWFEVTGYTALNFRGALKAFSTFSSSSEYVSFLAKVAMVCVAYFLCRRSSLIVLAPLCVLGIFLTGTRGPIAAILVATSVLIAVQGKSFKSWVPRFAIALVVSVMALGWGLQQAQEAEFTGTARAAVEHQSAGLQNPLESTATGHLYMMQEGIWRGIYWSPMGRGLGATTLASARFGGGGGSSEMDISNLFISLGVVGGTLYVALIVLVLLMAARYWQRTREPYALALLGILVVGGGGWLLGSHYSTSTLTWICIGALERGYREMLEQDASVEAHAVAYEEGEAAAQALPRADRA